MLDWKEVSKELPYHEDEVLVFNEMFMDQFTICTYLANEDKFYCNCSGNFIKRPTHWSYINKPTEG